MKIIEKHGDKPGSYFTLSFYEQKDDSRVVVVVESKRAYEVTYISGESTPRILNGGHPNKDFAIENARALAKKIFSSTDPDSEAKKNWSHLETLYDYVHNGKG